MSSLAQQALDIAVQLQAKRSNAPVGEAEMFGGILTALQLLAQSELAATPSSDTTDPGLTGTDVATTTADATPTT